MRLTADHQLAVIHDPTVDRTTNAAGPVADFTAAQLAALDARASYPAWPHPVGVPLLAQVLDAYAATVRLAIELKTDTPEHLERVCTLLVGQLERFLPRAFTVTSFDRTALEIMRRLAPNLPLAYIGKYDTPDYLETAIALGCRQADIPLRSGSPDTVAKAQAAGLFVVGWLGNTEADLEALAGWQVDGITTDYPTRALAFLRARGIMN